MTPFQFGGFWDVPRHIKLCYHGIWFYLRSEFDDDLDEYEDEYSIFMIPEPPTDLRGVGSWDFRTWASLSLVGKVPVNSVTFDERKQEELDASFLDKLVDELQR